MSKSEVPRAEDRLGRRVKEAHAALRSAMDRALISVGITVPQYVCLTMLAQGGQHSKAELARAVFVTRQTMTVLLDGMEARGHVARVDVPPTTRAVPYLVTAEGLRLLAEAEAKISRVEQAMTSDLTAGEEEVLGQLLARCAQNVRAYEAD